MAVPQAPGIPGLGSPSFVWRLLIVIVASLLPNNRSSAFVVNHPSSTHTPRRALLPTSSSHKKITTSSSTAVSAILDPSVILSSSTTTMSQVIVAADNFFHLDKDSAEALAGPLFGISLFPYLAFLYLLNVPENKTPKGVVVGFATCLLFVFLTIPAAIAAKLLYDVTLADCDWLHGSAESLLTITNLATVIPFRQALNAKSQNMALPMSASTYGPMVYLVGALTAVAIGTALVPAMSNPQVHTPYLAGFMDLSFVLPSNPEPDNALTVATWIIHVSSLVEFLVAMGFCWKWGDVVKNPTWKGLTWGLIPLHSSGITACVSHLFYNHIPILVPIQALLTCVGNTTAAYAAYRIAISNRWKPPESIAPLLAWVPVRDVTIIDDEDAVKQQESQSKEVEEERALSIAKVKFVTSTEYSSPPLVGFEDLGEALKNDNDYAFLIKLFAGCAAFSYIIKYGETLFEFPYDANVYVSLLFIIVPTALNTYKWNRRSKDPTFEGWF